MDTPTQDTTLLDRSDAADARRFRFLVRTADDLEGPEAQAMEKMAEQLDDKTELSSDALRMLIDSTMALPQFTDFHG